MRPGDFITADTHFGHEAIIGYAKRPFASASEMDDALVERWNAKVPPGATVYHLGDFALTSTSRIHRLLDRLNGSIRLVLGNHDRSVRKAAHLRERFEWTKDYHETKTEDGRRIVMCHYALLTWNGHHLGSWMLHGHSHGSLANHERVKRVDVGVDANDYAPLSFEDVRIAMGGLDLFPAVDHHRPRHR